VQKVYKRRIGVAATYQARQAVFPVNREELMKITTIWVDAAMKLSDKDIRVMTRIVRSQDRLGSTAPARDVSAEHTMAG